MTEEWGWWAGGMDGEYEVGPFDTKQDAIDEALGQGIYSEDKGPNGWQRIVYFGECRGEYFECSECGDPKKPCDGCCTYLSADELCTRFAQSRNSGSCVFEPETIS